MNCAREIPQRDDCAHHNDKPWLVYTDDHLSGHRSFLTWAYVGQHSTRHPVTAIPATRLAAQRGAVIPSREMDAATPNAIHFRIVVSDGIP